jgi:hypothetical protein
MEFTSPRKTAPYQILQSSPKTTSPITTAVSAKKQLSPIFGSNPLTPLIKAIFKSLKNGAKVKLLSLFSLGVLFFRCIPNCRFVGAHLCVRPIGTGKGVEYLYAHSDCKFE